MAARAAWTSRWRWRGRLSASRLLTPTSYTATATATATPTTSPVQRPSWPLTRSFVSDPRPPFGREGPSSVIAVKADTEYLSALNLAQEKKTVAVVYFTAKWCGPCKMISPVVDDLSMKYDKATFLKVDIDQEGLSEIVSNAKITSVPTFKFYQDGKSIGEVVGANATALKDRVAALCS